MLHLCHIRVIFKHQTQYCNINIRALAQMLMFSSQPSLERNILL